jgi:hypothetical protein
VIDASDLQSTLTDVGTIIIRKKHSANVDSSIRSNFESDSNVIDTSDLQLEKQDLLNPEIDDEIHARREDGEQWKSRVKLTIMPSRTIILRQNVVLPLWEAQEDRDNS